MPLTLQPSIFPYNYLNRYTVFDDFTSETQATNGYPYQESVSGAGAAVANQGTDTGNRPGVTGLALGTTTSGRAFLGLAANSIVFGSGFCTYVAAVYIPTLSDGTDTYSFLFGSFDTVPGPTQVDAVAFLYDTAGTSTGSAASANWQLLTASNSVRTYTTTGTAVPAATWVRLRIEVNNDASLATFYINGVSVGQHNSNIPTGVARAMQGGASGVKSAGTNSRSANLDYMGFDQIFTTPRLS